MWKYKQQTENNVPFKLIQQVPQIPCEQFGTKTWGWWQMNLTGLFFLKAKDKMLNLDKIVNWTAASLWELAVDWSIFNEYCKTIPTYLFFCFKSINTV